MNNNFVLILFCMIVLFSCKPANDEQSTLTKINKLEKLIYGNDLESSATTEDLMELSKMYQNYANNYAEQKAPEYFFKAAEVEKTMGNFENSIELFDQIIEEHADHDKVPIALFYKGFIYENDIIDLNAANKCYFDFVEKYPEHELIESVKFSMRNLGKPIDQIIQEFDAKNNPQVKPLKPKKAVVFEES